MGVDPSTGKYQVLDQHGNTTASPTVDDYVIPFTYDPKYYGGIQNTISYKGWQLSFLLQFVKQKAIGYLYNGIPGRFTYGNQPTDVLNRWQKPGDVTTIQRFSQNTSVILPWINARNSDQSLIDASYLRLRNASLSWNLKDRWIKMLHMQNGRLFVQGQNLFTMTNYKGLDPETRSSTSLPTLRIITFGIQVGL
jgi:hypothetical protein